MLQANTLNIILSKCNHAKKIWYWTPCYTQKQLSNLFDGMLPLYRLPIYWQIWIKYEHLRISTHRNDVWRADGLPWDKHFKNAGHKFNENAKFTIIKKINNTSLPKQQGRSLLEHSEDFWILRLEILSPKSLILSLNHPQDITGSIWKSYFSSS